MSAHTHTSPQAPVSPAASLSVPAPMSESARPYGKAFGSEETLSLAPARSSSTMYRPMRWSSVCRRARCTPLRIVDALLQRFGTVPGSGFDDQGGDGADQPD